MGEVFLADDTQLGRKVAIKFLAEALEADETARERLHREARSAAALDHPYICKIHELVVIGGRRGIVMEHVTGETLQARLRRAPLSPKEALEIAGEVAEALDEAHQHRVVHRDLKPSNVMLTTQGHVKVMDFGLAKQVRVEKPSDDQSTGSLTDPGVRVGTPGYMSPEQLLGGQVDERSDLFAFGILLYELLAGVHPFTRASPSGTMSAILKETPAPISQYAKDAPESARVTLDRLLAKEPHQRYQSFGDLRTDLGQLLQDPSGLTTVRRTAHATSTSTVERTPFVGRKSERAEARRLLDRVVAGQGGVLLLGGEPGVGKTRLAEEVLAEGRQRGCLALTGRCYETEGTPPFIPWVEIVERSARIVPPAALREALGEAAPEVAKLVPELRRTFPDIPPPIELPPQQQRRYLFNGFLEFVERAARVSPQVLLIDDLHWADDSTLLLLQHVAEHASEMPLLLVGTYRDVDLDVDRPFAKMLESLTRQRLARKIALKRLHERDVAGILQALSSSGRDLPPELASVIYRETEGNPFFVEEVFHHLNEEGRLFDDAGRWRSDLDVQDLDVPEGIRLVIGRRVQRLSADERRLLTTAAIVGRSFDLALMEAVSGGDDDAVLTALEAAEAAKLIVSVSSRRDARWEFAHGLIRQTLANSLSLPRRQRAHLRVADAMERIHGKRAFRHAVDLAHHLLQAGAAADEDRAIRYLTLAGDQELEAGAYDEALRQFDEALSLSEEGDGETAAPGEGDLHRARRADLHYKRGQALRSLARGEEALDEWRTALTDYEAIGNADGVARTAFDAAWEASWRGDNVEARAVARRALDALEDGDPASRARLLALLATFSAVAGDAFEASHGLLQEAESIAQRIEPSNLTAELLQARVRLCWSYSQCDQIVDIGPRAASARQQRGEVYEVCDITWALAFSKAFVGHLREALELVNQLEPLAARIGHDYAVWISQHFRAWHLFMTGDLDAAEHQARLNIEDAERKAIGWRSHNHLLLSSVLFCAGRWEEARAQIDKGLLVDIQGFTSEILPAWRVCFDAYHHGDDALDSLLESKSRLATLPEENTFGVWCQLGGAVEALAMIGRRKEVASLSRSVRHGDGQFVLMMSGSVSPPWQMIAGIAAACGDHWDAAQEHYETALKQAHDLPHKIAQPEVRRWYAQMLLDRNAPGDHDKARTLLGEAIGQYRTIGMPKHLAMAEGMLTEMRPAAHR